MTDRRLNGWRGAILATASLVAVTLLCSVPASAQTRPIQRPLLKTVLKAVNPTPEQQEAIKQIVQSHLVAAKTARQSGDLATARQERRDAFQAILKVLTPE